MSGGQYDPDDFLMGSSVPSAEFKHQGASITGIVKHKEMRQQKEFDSGAPKFWDDGRPMMMLIATLATDLRDASVENDNGDRRIFIFFKLHFAVVAAIKAAGAEKLEIGGKLTVTYVADDEPVRKGLNGAKLYRCEYVPADVIALQSNDEATYRAPAAAAPDSQRLKDTFAGLTPALPADAASDVLAAFAKMSQADRDAIAAMSAQDRQKFGLPPF